MNRMEAITENLANSTTPGYRRLQVDHKLFDLIFRDAMARPMNTNWKEGEKFDPITVDFTTGPMRTTDRPLDFALHGDGFFVLEQDGKEYYTRNGSFKLDTEGRLVNASNIPVKGRAGEILFPPRTLLSTVSVSPDGTIRAGERVLDTVQTAHFSDLSKLERVGPTLFKAPASMPPEALPEKTAILGRVLEESNTTVFAEMAEMISCMRAFEACQRMIRSQDDVQGKMIQQLA